MLTANGIPCTSLSCKNKVERRERLLAFSTGKFSAITAADVMNEGIDIPDVNILVFLRATHSRRIFIQQLGRGLRLSDEKEKVVVLDFVSDIRRLADVVEMDNEGKARGEKDNVLFLKDGIVSFSNEKTGKFIQEWLEDMADLGDEDDDSKLTFPEGF
jgi:superfamily II DNA or RNA helicase